MKTCDTCNAEKTSIPYVVHEATVTRLERINTRLWIVVLILIFALIASNLAWIIYEKQFEVIESDTIGERERRCESIRRYGRVNGRGCRTQQKSV